MAGNKGLFGIVLAGGQSQRLGRDKCLIELGSEDFVARTSALIAPFCSQTWIVGRDASRHGLNMLWTLDDYPGKGPLGGILTGLSRARGQACLVLACDLPFMDAATLDELVRCREKRAGKTVMTTFEQSETGFIESLVSIYEPQAVPFLRAGLKSGVHKLSRLIPGEFRQSVVYSQSRSLPFFNVNYPCDLELLMQFERLGCPRTDPDLSPAWEMR